MTKKPKHSRQSTTVPRNRPDRRPTPTFQPVSRYAVDSQDSSWSLDVVKDSLKHGEGYRSFHVTDNKSQAQLCSQSLGPSPARQVVRALDTLRERYDVPRSILVDNGREFHSQMLADWAASLGIKLLLIKHAPHRKSLVERLHRNRASVKNPGSVDAPLAC